MINDENRAKNICDTIYNSFAGVIGYDEDIMNDISSLANKIVKKEIDIENRSFYYHDIAPTDVILAINGLERMKNVVDTMSKDDYSSLKSDLDGLSNWCNSKHIEPLLNPYVCNVLSKKTFLKYHIKGCMIKKEMVETECDELTSFLANRTSAIAKCLGIDNYNPGFKIDAKNYVFHRAEININELDFAETALCGEYGLYISLRDYIRFKKDIEDLREWIRDGTESTFTTSAITKTNLSKLISSGHNSMLSGVFDICENSVVDVNKEI